MRAQHGDPESFLRVPNRRREHVAPRTLAEALMAFDPGLAARVADTLAQLGHRGVRQKNVFGGRGFLRGKSTFVIVWDDGLIVKTRREEYERLLREPGVTPFAGSKPCSCSVAPESWNFSADIVLSLKNVSWSSQKLSPIRR